MNLNDVYWVGGSARAGKTTISNRFENATVYHTDDIFMGAIPASKERQPLLWRLQNDGPYDILRMSSDDCLKTWLGIYSETFEVLKNEIIKLETSNTVLVEGVCLLPELLAENGISRACFLISPQAFFEEELDKLSKFQADMQAQDNSNLIHDNINALMKSIRTHIEKQAKKYNFYIIPVDEEHDLDTNAKLASEYFSLSLS